MRNGIESNIIYQTMKRACVEPKTHHLDGHLTNLSRLGIAQALDFVQGLGGHHQDPFNRIDSRFLELFNIRHIDSVVLQFSAG